MNILKRIGRFYLEGFRGMPGYGRKLWIIIFIKLFIMFAIFRLFFFKDFLNTNFETDADRSDYVIEQLIDTK